MGGRCSIGAERPDAVSTVAREAGLWYTIVAI
jgi:hypothetical protein